MKETKGNFLRRSKGITLVALVVTIVILIILATISVSVVFGEKGLIKQAQQGRQDYLNAQEEEKGMLGKVEEDVANMLAESEGGNEEQGPNIDPETGWDLNKVNKEVSDDKKIVPVPKGYTASTITGEKSVDTGFVIKEGSNGEATEGINEFVWVPVENISDLYDSTNNAGQLWRFGKRNTETGIYEGNNPAIKIDYPSTTNLEYREPDVITVANEGSDSTSGEKYDAELNNLKQAGLAENSTAKDLKIQLQNEFKEMRESVEIYGGFYIGRYETGDLSKEKAVTKKRNEDIANQTWYTQYKLNKTIAVNGNVKSSMIWGSQYDATLRWMQSSSNPEISNFPTNSENKGNYLEQNENKIIATGTKKEYAINNVYDLAGNVWEGTMETWGNNGRVTRGGCYTFYGNSRTAGYRMAILPTKITQYYGSRSTLYINI